LAIAANALRHGQSTGLHTTLQLAHQLLTQLCRRTPAASPTFPKFNAQSVAMPSFLKPQSLF
jgi:hypothetical protein